MSIHLHLRFFLSLIAIYQLYKYTMSSDYNEPILRCDMSYFWGWPERDIKVHISWPENGNEITQTISKIQEGEISFRFEAYFFSPGLMIECLLCTQGHSSCQIWDPLRARIEELKKLLQISFAEKTYVHLDNEHLH